jgi:hypothetical protein
MALMAICCLIPLALIFFFSSASFNVKEYSWLILLLCPLMMVWMMKDMHHGKKEGKVETMGGTEDAAKTKVKDKSCH